MKAPRVQGRGRVGMNMTPMIDVVFLLIIFFLVSSHLARQEQHLPLELPGADSGERVIEDTEMRRLVVNVMPGGQMVVAGRDVASDRLREIIAVEKKAGGGELEIRIRADKQAQYKTVEPILVAAAESGVWKVQFTVVDREAIL